MLLLKQVSVVQDFLAKIRKKNYSIGFVPTMGALHQGHLSLIDTATKASDFTICSIFVNPTQFNEKKDLQKYPRTPAEDVLLLLKANNNLIFFPTDEEIYPKNKEVASDFNLGNLAEILEGYFRPGHFQGVAQVVNRLLEIVCPDKLFMGQKDFQQLAIIRKIIQQNALQTELIACPTVREPSGLAMSSRNARLSEEARKKASTIYQALTFAKNKRSILAPSKIKELAIEQLKVAGLEVEYFELVNGHTLAPIHSFSEVDYIVAVTAVWIEQVRLIDNIIIKNSNENLFT